MPKYRYVKLKQKKDKFGFHNGYTQSKPHTIVANTRELAKKELDATLKGKLYKLLRF